MKSRLLLLVCSGGLWLSCQHKKNHIHFEKEAFLPLVAEALPDSFGPPAEIPVTAANAPKPIRIEPTRIPLKFPYGVGKPTITKYGVADGLPPGNVQDMVKDKYGNFWIGGLGNLSKFDGSSFTNYPSSAGFGSGAVMHLLFDSIGVLWIQNWDGLYTFNGQSFRQVNLGEHDAQLYFGGLVKDNAGDIWVDTNKGVFRIHKDSVIHFTVKDREEGFIYSMIKSNSGQVLLGTEKGIAVFDGERFISYPGVIFEGKRINPLLSDSKGNIWYFIWVNRNTELRMFDGVNTRIFGVKEGFINNSFIGSMTEDGSGNIWISTSKKLFRYRDGRFFEFIDKAESGVSGSRSFIKDEAGDLWTGGVDGLARISMNYQNILEMPGETKEVTVASNLTIDKNAVKWVLGSNSQTLIKYDRDEAAVYDLSSMLDKKQISNIYADKSGNIWMTVNGQEPELIRFDGTRFYRFGKVYAVNVRSAWNISEEGEGIINVSGYGGMYRYDGKTITRFGPRQGFPGNMVTYLSDSRSRKWIGTDTSGVIMMAGDSVLRITKKNGLDNIFINALAEDPSGNIWIGTDGGVSRFDGKKITSFGMSDGIGNGVIKIVMDTSNKLIWFGNTLGLTSIPFSESSKPGPVFTTYSQLNGFNLIPSLFATQNNLLMDSTDFWMVDFAKGIVRFDFKKVQKMAAPPLRIRNIRVNNTNLLWSMLAEGKDPVEDSLMQLNEAALKFGKPADRQKADELSKKFGKIEFDSFEKGSMIPQNLRLPFSNNSITFEFAAVSPSFGKYIRYRYKLDGYEDNWSPWSTKGEAFFGNIGEGKYRFHLEAYTPYGTTTTLFYDFTVLPPWYRTWWAYTLYAVLLISGIILFIRWRIKALHVEKAVLEEKVNTRTAELKVSLENLKTTQSQLVHAEKMASLGELTAGIAHEIQNPLNFVNNFSEINNELIEEVKNQKEKINSGELDNLLNDIYQNNEKISHHGKRADAIVKGMLLHSRSSSGVKELTDINALCDEYLRLAYHGLRAKDKSFNANFETAFDPTIGKINIMTQDFGRVILNLINNAFYAVNEKKKSHDPSTMNYEPTVIISTRKEGEKIVISVNDNGNGIPQNVKEKIFQPFFTTKPTGEGTGLGLSLSYDIVRAHGGEIKVNTKDNEGTAFVIQIPIT